MKVVEAASDTDYLSWHVLLAISLLESETVNNLAHSQWQYLLV
jgi:hypothetical protein